MSTKQVVMFVLDAGHGMDQMKSQNSSRLKFAIQCIQITLQQKIYFNPNHEIGFGIFGDADFGEDDNNFLLLHPISKPNTQLLVKMYQMSEAKLQNEKAGGDIFRAIQYSIKLIQKHCGKKSINKRMFVFTNGKGQTTYEENRIKYLALQLKANNIKCNIIPIDFMQGYNLQTNQIQGYIENNNQLINANLLIDLKQNAQDNIQIFPDQIAIELYKKFRKRQVNPVAIYKGQFQIAPDLGLGVQTYKFIRRQRLKSLAKYDINQPFDPNIPKYKQITSKIGYIIQGDQTNTQIEKQNQMNAYNYGPHLVPISSILQKQAKFYQDRNMRLLGFVDKSRINRAAFMSQVQLMVPNKDQYSRKLFTALVFSMISTNKYGIARYVPRNSKNGVIPRLMVLIPYRGNQKQGIYLIDLPTVEDVRDYPFNSLKVATDKQRQLVKEMISKMQLHKRTDDIDIQQLKMQNTFNPAHQYFYQTLFYRVVHNEGDIPVLNQQISKYLNPQQRIYEQTQPFMKAIRKQFKFTRKQLAKEKAAKKQLLWKEALQNQMPAVEDKSLVSSETGDDLKPNKVFMEDDNENFDQTNPLLSFNKMLSNNKMDLVDKALNYMSNFIKVKHDQALTQDNLNFLVQCASNMRRGCDEQQQPDFWDNWLENASEDLPRLYKKIIGQGLGFLKKDNTRLYKPSNLHVIEIEEDFQDLD